MLGPSAFEAFVEDGQIRLKDDLVSPESDTSDHCRAR